MNFLTFRFFRAFSFLTKIWSTAQWVAITGGLNLNAYDANNWCRETYAKWQTDKWIFLPDLLLKISIHTLPCACLSSIAHAFQLLLSFKAHLLPFRKRASKLMCVLPNFWNHLLICVSITHTGSDTVYRNRPENETVRLPAPANCASSFECLTWLLASCYQSSSLKHCR